MPPLSPTSAAAARPKVRTLFSLRFPSLTRAHPSAVWGVIWLIVAVAFFAGGVLVGLVAFKVRYFPSAYDLRFPLTPHASALPIAPTGVRSAAKGRRVALPAGPRLERRAGAPPRVVALDARVRRGDGRGPSQAVVLDAHLSRDAADSPGVDDCGVLLECTLRVIVQLTS